MGLFLVLSWSSFLGALAMGEAFFQFDGAMNAFGSRKHILILGKLSSRMGLTTG